MLHISIAIFLAIASIYLTARVIPWIEADTEAQPYERAFGFVWLGIFNLFMGFVIRAVLG